MSPMPSTPLGRLIDEVQQARDMSDEDVARTARRLGHKLSKQTLSAVKNTDPLKTLVPSTLRAIAAGLDKPLAEIVQAALPSVGLPAVQRDDWSTEEAIRADHRLPPTAKRMLLGLLAQAVTGGTVIPIRPVVLSEQAALSDDEKP